MLQVFKGMTLIDGKGQIINNAVVVVDGAKIIQVGEDNFVQIPGKAKINDLAGKFMLPGLIDAHVHILYDASNDPVKKLEGMSDPYLSLIGAKNLNETLDKGITYIRDLGGRNYVEIDLKRALSEDVINGPSMQVAGKAIVMTGGHGYVFGREADGEVEVRRAAREQIKHGAKVIKLMATGGVMTEGVQPGSPQLTEEEMRSAVEEGHKAGAKVSVHAQGNEGIKNALRAGVDSIEHGTYLDQEAIDLMVENSVFLVPTLSAPYWVIEAGEEFGIPSFMIEKTCRNNDSHLKSFQMAREAGINIAMGTDAGTPANRHGNNAYELKLMVDAGMSTMEAIVSATKSAAELLNINDEFGTVEVGKYADLLVLGANPVDNIEAFLDIEQVYKSGRPVKGTNMFN